jgi:hypothetical protein
MGCVAAAILYYYVRHHHALAMRIHAAVRHPATLILHLMQLWGAPQTVGVGDLAR